MVIDEDDFETASKEFDELAISISELRSEILDMLEDLRTGFDTPAGRKFYRSCGAGLVLPLYQQAAVVKHISENLRQAKKMYQSVFDEYREIVKYINDSE